MQRTLRKDEVYDRILAAILAGTLEPGERIRDGDLQAWLGVSRTPIRLALDRLEGMRLVESVPNRYTRVCDVGPERVPQLIEVLCALWSLAVRLSVARFDAAAQIECRRRIAQAIEACRAHSGPDATRLVETLRTALAFFSEQSGNPLLAVLVARAGAPLRFQLGPQGAALDTRLLAQFLTRLDAAVRQRDAGAAADAVGFLRAEAVRICRAPVPVPA